MPQIPNTVCISLKGETGALEIAIARLSGIGFYAFEEVDEGLRAYISETDFDATETKKLLSDHFAGEFAFEVIPPKDWNAEWEKNFEGITVDDFCEVIPPFKEPSGKTKFTVIIHPKMAFGTGHHATTQLMISQCRKLDFKEKRALDMGTGSGILAILAEKIGAAEVIAIDNDPWSFENANENATLNGCRKLRVICGDASAIPRSDFAIIFANINRNILLQDGHTYCNHLAKGGHLIVSGFFDFDRELIHRHFTGMGLEIFSEQEASGWVSICFMKRADNVS